MGSVKITLRLMGMNSPFSYHNCKDKSITTPYLRQKREVNPPGSFGLCEQMEFAEYCIGLDKERK